MKRDQDQSYSIRNIKLHFFFQPNLEEGTQKLLNINGINTRGHVTILQNCEVK